MHTVDVVDETFVVADPAQIAAELKRPESWRELFPELELVVLQDRGVEGARFGVTGALVGSSEFWIEPWRDGAIVHYYLRADLTRRGSAVEPRTGDPARLGRAAVRARIAHCVRLKRGLNALKDRLEAGRPPGVPRSDPDAARGQG